ncbi:hypothetical protein [Inhella proteolytica]|uniref:hypothetical protein n=1 Tax=Inhella proteolytica TaxID=2795029 RepID=UPI001E5E8DE1|nr:hypothetical protein [Inhella proteolytica]
MLNAVVRAVFVVAAAVLTLGLLALGLLVAAVLLAVFGLRRLLARLLGRPQPRRPDFRFATQAWPRRQQARGAAGEVVDAEVREVRDAPVVRELR